MKYFKLLSITVGVLVLFVAIFIGCKIQPDFEGDISAYTPKGDIIVQADNFDSSAIFTTKLFGDSEGIFTQRSVLSRSVSCRDLNDEYYFHCSELLKRFDEEKYFVSYKSYSFSGFKIVADIFIKGDYWWNNSTDLKQSILTWGGDADDLANYVDLATGEFVSTDNSTNIHRGIYTSILIQLNAPAETITPDFGNDEYGILAFSWGDVKPFFSTNSSAQHIILSTYIDKPYAKWLGGEYEGFSNYITVQEFKDKKGVELRDFEDWAFNAPLNQEFFNAVKSLEHTTDPCSGEAWIFLPLYNPIDLTTISNVSFSFEFFMKDLFEVYFEENGNANFIISVGKSYTDQEGHVYYSPLPIKASYFESENGFPIVE
jgi:hypothetical protein